MKVIGLCGGSGSGKTSATKSFINRGIPSLNTDELYHSMIAQNSDCARELADAFGERIRNSSGGIDRKALADIVFREDKKNLKILDKIAHKHVVNECKKWILKKEKEGARAVLIDAPLLFESGFDKECDVIVAVIAGEEERIKRIIDRDSLTEEEAKKRIENQIDDKLLAERVNYVIENDSSEQALDLQVEKICRLILR